MKVFQGSFQTAAWRCAALAGALALYGLGPMAGPVASAADPDDPDYEPAGWFIKTGRSGPLPEVEKGLGESRPGYRSQPTRESQALYHQIMAKAAKDPNSITAAERLMMRFMIATRTWPDAPEITDIDREAQARADRAIRNHPVGAGGDLVYGVLSADGKLNYDIPPPKTMEAFRQWYYKTPPKKRSMSARFIMTSCRAGGYDMRSDEQRKWDARHENAARRKWEAQREARSKAIQEGREHEAQREKDAQDFFDGAHRQQEAELARQRLRNAIERSKHEGENPPKEWGKMTPAERHQALKKGEPHAIDNAMKDLRDLFNVPREATIGNVADDRSARAADKTRSAMDTMEANAQVAKASTSGDQQVREAERARDAAGADAQRTRDDSTAKTAQADRDNSTGKALADGLAKGVEQGFSKTAAAMGHEAAGAAVASIFPEQHEKTASVSRSKAKKAAAGAATAAAAGAAKAANRPRGGRRGKKAGPPKGGGGAGPRTTSPDDGRGNEGAAVPEESGGGAPDVGDTSTTDTAETPAATGDRCGRCGYRPCRREPSSEPDISYYIVCPKCGWKMAVETNPNGPFASPGVPKETAPAPAPEPPAPAPIVHKCPRCGGVVTDDDWYMSNYGPAIHCPHCKGAIKVGWSP